jgi:septal ring factor EnvC (AmiA/AmiB activator)
VKFLKTRAIVGALTETVKDKANDVKSNYVEQKAELQVRAAAAQTEAEIKAAADRKAALEQQIKDARKAARDAGRELKNLATQVVENVTHSDEVPAPKTADNVVSL